MRHDELSLEIMSNLCIQYVTVYLKKKFCFFFLWSKQACFPVNSPFWGRLVEKQELNVLTRMTENSTSPAILKAKVHTWFFTCMHLSSSFCFPFLFTSPINKRAPEFAWEAASHWSRVTRRTHGSQRVNLGTPTENKYSSNQNSKEKGDHTAKDLSGEKIFFFLPIL